MVVVSFLGFLAGICKEMWRRMEQVPIYRLFAFFGAIVIISLNVGLESPGYWMIFVLAMGLASLRSDGIHTRWEEI